MTRYLTLLLFITVAAARFLDKDASDGIPAKYFEYYDVAKGNIPTYLTVIDKPLEPKYEEDSEPVKLNGAEDNNLHQMIQQEHAIEVAPAENRQENGENYDEYAEETNSKPIKIVDGETTDDETKLLSETEPASDSKSKLDKDLKTVDNDTKPLSDDTTNATVTTEAPIVSKVDDVMELRYVKPLCDTLTENCGEQ